jgi:triphosphoribosyl-dephospho-CoA synthase
MNEIDRVQACYLRACELDVSVRKPGNVSRASAGHRMRAEMFLASAHASAPLLFRSPARVGERIEAAVDASWAAAGCNTNLGIVLLCAPIAVAIERRPEATTAETLRASIESVLADLDLRDAEAAYRAIARARPGGLGNAPNEDVHAPPTIELRAAMALAAPRDRIARQYAEGYADLFETGLQALDDRPANDDVNDNTHAAVQRLYLAFLARFPDSHIVRNHGEAVAHSVMTAAQAWGLKAHADCLGDDPEFIAWDEALKAARINPGTTADLTVATLLIAGVLGRGGTERDTCSPAAGAPASVHTNPERFERNQGD